jgi:hypothetical protein
MAGETSAAHRETIVLLSGAGEHPQRRCFSPFALTSFIFCLVMKHNIAGLKSLASESLRSSFLTSLNSDFPDPIVFCVKYFIN